MTVTKNTLPTGIQWFLKGVYDTITAPFDPEKRISSPPKATEENHKALEKVGANEIASFAVILTTAGGYQWITKNVQSFQTNCKKATNDLLSLFQKTLTPPQKKFIFQEGPSVGLTLAFGGLTVAASALGKTHPSVKKMANSALTGSFSGILASFTSEKNPFLGLATGLGLGFGIGALSLLLHSLLRPINPYTTRLYSMMPSIDPRLTHLYGKISSALQWFILLTCIYPYFRTLSPMPDTHFDLPIAGGLAYLGSFVLNYWIWESMKGTPTFLYKNAGFFATAGISFFSALALTGSIGPLPLTS